MPCLSQPSTPSLLPCSRPCASQAARHGQDYDSACPGQPGARALLCAVLKHPHEQIRPCEFPAHALGWWPPLSAHSAPPSLFARCFSTFCLPARSRFSKLAYCDYPSLGMACPRGSSGCISAHAGLRTQESLSSTSVPACQAHRPMAVRELCLSAPPTAMGCLSCWTLPLLLRAGGRGRETRPCPLCDGRRPSAEYRLRGRGGQRAERAQRRRERGLAPPQDRIPRPARRRALEPRRPRRLHRCASAGPPPFLPPLSPPPCTCAYPSIAQRTSRTIAQHCNPLGRESCSSRTSARRFLVFRVGFSLSRAHKRLAVTCTSSPGSTMF